MTTETILSPDDEPTPAELAEAGAMREIDDLPSPWTIKGDPLGLLSAPTLEALSPADRQTVRERADGTDEASINAALVEFIRARRREAIIRCGPGEGASACEREALCQLHQIRQLDEERARLEFELAEAPDARIDYDADGKQIAVPNYRHVGDARTAREARIAQIDYEVAQIEGRQGQIDLQAARRADALRTRDARRHAEEAAEMRRMGEALLRQERLEKGAQAYAKHRRPSLG